MYILDYQERVVRFLVTCWATVTWMLDTWLLVLAITFSAITLSLCLSVSSNLSSFSVYMFFEEIFMSSMSLISWSLVWAVVVLTPIEWLLLQKGREDCSFGNTVLCSNYGKRNVVNILGSLCIHLRNFEQTLQSAWASYWGSLLNDWLFKEQRQRTVSMFHRISICIKSNSNIAK